MPVCTKHNNFYKGDICLYCFRENSKSQKVKSKVTKQSPLIKKAHELFSKFIRSKYDKNGYTNCFTCNKVIATFGGLFGAHCGHYFPKNEYWLLAFDERNAGIQCYDCNVNKPFVIPQMRRKLVDIYGEEEIKKLEDLANDFHLKKKAKIYKTKPDAVFLTDIIKRLS